MTAHRFTTLQATKPKWCSTSISQTIAELGEPGEYGPVIQRVIRVHGAEQSCCFQARRAVGDGDSQRGSGRQTASPYSADAEQIVK